MRLGNHSRVVIVGGGPAGSFAALHLLRLAGAAALALEVIVLEPRDFNQPGPGGCNKCAGILSSTLVRHLEALGLNLPPDVIQSELEVYILHLGQGELTIRRPDPLRRIVSVYRGSGPRLGAPPLPRAFDGWLLAQARARGAVVRRAHVQTVRPGSRPTVVTAQENLEADLVIVATGTNSRTPLDPAWGYRPPAVERMWQGEVPIPNGLSGDGVHIFFDRPPGLIFGGLIPKGRYANISLLGRGLTSHALDDFLAAHLPAQGLVEASVLCTCAPRVAVGPAAGIYADRLVVVGDAAVSRLYKDGIGAAFVTAEAAARTAVQVGIARRDFAAGYRPLCRRIAADNVYGQILFSLWDISRRAAFLQNIWWRTVVDELNLPPAARTQTRALWGMFTGDASYQRIFWLAFSLPAFRGLWRNVLKRRNNL